MMKMNARTDAGDLTLVSIPLTLQGKKKCTIKFILVNSHLYLGTRNLYVSLDTLYISKKGL